MEPVFVRGIPAIFKYILKCPEAASHMVKYTIQDNLDSRCMQLIDNLLEILVRAKTAVDLRVISRIVAVCIALEYR